MTLALENISIDFGGIKALSHVSFQIPDGRITGLIGPNGAGKTTLFNIITRFYQQNQGSIRFYEKNINSLKTHQLTSIGICRTFQNVQLFNSLSVYDNIRICCPTNRRTYFNEIFSIRSFTPPQKQLIEDAIDFLDLGKYKYEIAGELPLGIQKRVEIARSLVLKPKLLLLDEPAAGLNSKETQELTHKITEINQRFRTAILLVEHDMKMVMGVCEKIVVLNFGQVIAEGTSEEIRNDDRVIKAYLGSDDHA